MTLPAVPDWLAQRDGTLKPGVRDNVLFVVVGGTPLYRLESRPAQGKETCQVTLTNNGRRLDGGKEYTDQPAAFAGGLDELRAYLGW